VTAEKNRVMLLKDELTLPLLRERAAALYPPRPDRIPDLEAWLRDTDALMANLSVHRESLRTLESAADMDAAKRDDRERLTKLVADLVALNRPDSVLAKVRDRLLTAKTIGPRTLGDHAKAWKYALARIRVGGRYAWPEKGPKMTEQLGLIPLGPDPKSQLEEFLHWESHERAAPLPGRGEGGLSVKEETGIVLILIPGGTFRMGAVPPKSEGRLGPNLDPNAKPDEGPVHDVELAPFFISKYEMTQAQWVRIMGHNPSQRRSQRDLRRPVEQITWDEAVEACFRVGLVLPTEAQWEYAARADTDSIWPVGNHASKLKDFANLADAYAEAHKALPSWDCENFFTDRYTFTAPVGKLNPNQWGLHDVSGNVWEWCQGGYSGPYRTDALEPGTGLHLGGRTGVRVSRGGSFDLPATGVRSSLRYGRPRKTCLNTLGVRPACRLQLTRKAERIEGGGLAAPSSSTRR
jgi:formylglycine-generating enzyme required for sulfatase activity